MAKGSVRKKGKKWYYRFYVENESGNLVQREFIGIVDEIFSVCFRHMLGLDDGIALRLV